MHEKKTLNRVMKQRNDRVIISNDAFERGREKILVDGCENIGLIDVSTKVGGEIQRASL